MHRQCAWILGCLGWLSACESQPFSFVDLRATGGASSGGQAASGGQTASGGDSAEAGGGRAGSAGAPATVSCERGVAVLAGAVVNARDLGGIPLAAEASSSCGELFRGPPLANLTAAGCQQVAELGVRTVIDLRVASERATKPTAACVAGQATLLEAPLPIPYNVSARDYIVDMNTASSIASVFHALGDAASYPVYFHCTWGRDRTGVVASLILSALGASRADILRDYTLSQATVGAYPSSLEGMLDELERQGGIEVFLATLGISEAELGTLRAHLALP